MRNDAWRLYALLWGVAGFIILIDQITKALVTSRLSHGRSVELIGGAVRLVSAANSGAAFSLFRSGGVAFMLVAAGVALGIAWFYRQLGTAPLATRIALALVVGGAVGNLVDRVRLGYVVDFIDLGWWPVFNVADSAIVLGAATLALVNFFPRRAEIRV
jgi:signal peptidase II